MYCLKYRKNTEAKNPKIVKNGRIMLLSNRAVFNNKKLSFIKEQQPSGLLISFLVVLCFTVLTS